MTTTERPTARAGGRFASSGQESSLPSEQYIPRAMPPILGTFDMTATYVIALFLINNAVLTATGGTVGLTYLILGAITFFIPCVIAVAQLGVMFPHEGSLYNWTYKALGSYWSFFIGLCYWLSGVLAAVVGGSTFISILQGLNSSWLTEPWQQGLVVLIIIAVATIINLQRFRTVQNFINIAAFIILVAVILMGLSAVVWFAKGHASMTSFSHLDDWNINPTNFALFGVIALNYIGASGPLNMAGEINVRRAITRSLLWGLLIVFTSYFICTFAVLVVRGQAILTAPVLAFEVITTVDTGLGKTAGSITTICILCYYIASTIFYTYMSARLLLVAGIDQRIPTGMGRLNKNRVPANAILVQAVIAAIFTVVIFVIGPYVVTIGKATDVATIFYNVTAAALTIIWTIATAFFFINLLFIYRRDPQDFRRKRIFPMPIIWASVVVGFIACVLTIIDTLGNSWIVQIGNDKWWYIVGGLTLLCLAFAAVGSMVANSEADWESLSH